MQEDVFNEFVKYDDKLKRGKIDFYGEDSPLFFNDQKEFLSHYIEFMSKEYGKNLFNEKAFSEAEIIKNLKNIKIDRNEKYSAYKRESHTVFLGWHLYTKRAKILDKKVVLNDDFTFPVPCAKYEFSCGVLRFDFDVKISKSYYHKSPEGVLTTTTGRFIEFRADTQEIVKLYFSPDGRVFYKNGKVKPYHYDLCLIGEYVFDDINSFSVIFGREDFTVTFNNVAQNFEYTKREKIDNIFIGGGMQPVGTWEVKPTLFIDNDGRERNVFCNNSTFNDNEEYIGDVTLPFKIGTRLNKDKELVLRKNIDYDNCGNVIVRVGALDPGGYIKINDNMVFETDSFAPFNLDITKYLKNGNNEMEIVVCPRAPESLFPWHKNDDYYNAWFCNDIDIVKTKTGFDADITTRTLGINGENVRFDIRIGTTSQTLSGLNFRLYIKKMYPEEKKAVLLDEGRFYRRCYSKRFEKKLDLWDCENPNMYSVILELFDDNQNVLLKKHIETGFRLIEQKKGGIYLNGKRIVLKGALNMQFLPPIDKVPLTHLCPSDEEIMSQVLALKKMSANVMRLHQLGYGSNDRRFYRICDKMGLMLIATTRLIDCAENMQWTTDFKQSDEYKKQIRYSINHPSIIMWEGSNELHTTLDVIDRIYDNFVDTVKSVDKTRLICPVSHLYYGGGIYNLGCKYYNNSGDRDELDNPAKSSYGWKDKLVVRSAHTYALLLGYGASWQRMKTQDWKWQPELFKDKDRAYLVSEYAIIGRQNPNTYEAKEFINKDSYELGDELSALGNNFTDDEWQLSQAFQALCALNANKTLLKNNADGMIWCCLSGGANNGSYLKPLIDFYGYKKLVYYCMKESFASAVAFNINPDVLYFDGYKLKPFVSGLDKGEKYFLSVEVIDYENNKTLLKKVYRFTATKYSKTLPSFKLKLPNGYYQIKYTTIKE